MTAGPADRIARRIVVHGKVQGVWFRGWTVEQARSLGLDGWVRNRMDGTVEALVAGPADTVDALIALCRQGPAAARIDGVEIAIADLTEIVSAGFAQRATV